MNPPACLWRWLALLWCCGTAMHAQVPVAPASMVQDETRLFDEGQRSRLSAQLLEVRERLGVRVFIAALTYASDEKAGDTASRLAAAWSEGGAALVLMHDRGKGQSVMAVSRGFWERYPTEEVVALNDSVAGLLLRPDRPADQQISDAVPAIIPRLGRMESHRLRSGPRFGLQEVRLGAALAGGLVLLLLLGMVFLGMARRREAARARKHVFPDVDVAIRLGAPLGGGSVAEARAD